MILMALHTHGAEKLSATALVDTVSSSGLLFLVIQQWVWNESLSLFGVEVRTSTKRKINYFRCCMWEEVLFI